MSGAQAHTHMMTTANPPHDLLVPLRITGVRRAVTAEGCCRGCIVYNCCRAVELYNALQRCRGCREYKAVRHTEGAVEAL